MLAQYVFVLVKLRRVSENSQKIIWGYIGVGLFSVAMCYIQFAPVMVCAVVVIMLYDFYKSGRISFKWKYVKLFVGIAAILMVAAFVGYKYVFHDAGVDLLYALQLGEQQNIGLEVLLMLPCVILIILNNMRKENKMTDMQVAYMGCMGVQLLFTVLSICHIMSTYYLQKSYFILFVLSIIIIIEGKDNLGKEIVKSVNILYVGLLGFFVLSYAGSESKTFSLQQSTLVQNMSILSEYNFSEGELSDNSKIYLMQYAMEELQDGEKVIPLIVSGGKGRGNGLWLDATYNDYVTVIYIEDASCTAEQMDELLKKVALHTLWFFLMIYYIYMICTITLIHLREYIEMMQDL